MVTINEATVSNNRCMFSRSLLNKCNDVVKSLILSEIPV